MQNGATGSLFLRRIGSLVFAELVNVQPAMTTSHVILNLPAGFQNAAGFAYYSTRPSSSPTQQNIVVITTQISLSLSGYALANGAFTFILPPWETPNDWPTVLPGTAQGTIPLT